MVVTNVAAPLITHLMCSNFLQNERQPDIGVLGSLGCTNRVRLLSSKAWNTNGSLISFDLNINTY